jgi:hypothetical protein
MLLIFYIILTILIYNFFCKKCGIIYNSNNLKKYNNATVNQENFIGVSSLLLTLVGNNNINTIVNDNIINNHSNVNNNIKVDKINEKNPLTKINKKHIFIIENESFEGKFKYRFYDKELNNYMNLYGSLGVVIKELKLLDLENNIIGNLLSEKHNKFILNSNLYGEKNINIEFYNNFNEIKIYLNDSDKIFFIKNVKNTYLIYLYSKFIGKIYFLKEGKNNKYKITVYEEYKNYLNLFALGFIMMVNSK